MDSLLKFINSKPDMLQYTAFPSLLCSIPIWNPLLQRLSNCFLNLFLNVSAAFSGQAAKCACLNLTLGNGNSWQGDEENDPDAKLWVHFLLKSIYVHNLKAYYFIMGVLANIQFRPFYFTVEKQQAQQFI